MFFWKNEKNVHGSKEQHAAHRRVEPEHSSRPAEMNQMFAVHLHFTHSRDKLFLEICLENFEGLQQFDEIFCLAAAVRMMLLGTFTEKFG